MSTSWYRRSLFNYKGNREFTRTGYEAAASRFVEEDLDVDCSDRHYMITGSNSGIGLQTALQVARRGGIIHMVCRNKESATKARSEIITTTGNDKIHLHIVNLAKPREVILWAQQFAAQHEKLHVLINNAGCMVHDRILDEDGVESNFAVNTLAIHILTLTFMPLLQRSEDPRVVTVSSAGLLCVRLDPHDLMHANMEPFNGRIAYSQHKRQQVVLSLWYAQHYNRVHFSSMHPGWADTPAVRTAIPDFYETMKDNLRTPAQGADTVVWLAISRGAVKHPGGLFFQDREPVSTHLPLAWTKSSMEEEDFLVSNIQKIYTEIYNKIYNPDGTPAASPTTNEEPDPSQAQESTQESSAQNQETETTEGNDKANKETEPVTYPVLRPPPPPAEKSMKSEVQEVAEINSPPESEAKEETEPIEPTKEARESHSTTETKEATQDSEPNHSPVMKGKADSEDENLTPSTPVKESNDSDTSSTTSIDQVTAES